MNISSSSTFSSPFLKPQTSLFTFLHSPPPNYLPNPFRTTTTISLSSSSSFQAQTTPYEDEHIIGDCVVFEDGIFDDPYVDNNMPTRPRGERGKENLVPEKWKELQAEINITKKERKYIAQQIEFGSKLEKKNRMVPPVNTKEYLSYKEMKLKQLKPVVLENPSWEVDEEEAVRMEKREVEEGRRAGRSGRVMPRNPRMDVYKGTLDGIEEFFNNGEYQPGENARAKSEGPRKLFTKEEKFLLNKRIPSLSDATSGKWLPLQTLAASGEFYLVDALLKHNVDINATDTDGLTALHKAILCKKLAVANYLLRECANPFILDRESASLMHYAVQIASLPIIKILLLYNVDINLADKDGWTPLHLAVQTRRTDVVKLLLIKGADKTLRNKDGLTPLDMCLYSGRDTKTYELLKILKQLPKLQAPLI